MLNRRQFLGRGLQGASLLAMGTVVPEFLAQTALAAEKGKDNILVVLEMTGGNDGLNTVIPYEDDIYHKARPTLAFRKQDVVRVDDEVGLHPAMRPMEQMLRNGQVAVVQGVGYPNPDRSHFESMDIWQSADPARRTTNGWIARGVPMLQDSEGNIPVMQVAGERLPLALKGAPAGIVSISNQQSFKLELGGDASRHPARRNLLRELSEVSSSGSDADALQFVQRRQLQTYSSLEKLQEVLSKGNRFANGNNRLFNKLQLIAELIQKDLGTRVYYVSIDGFDTHSGQAQAHQNLLGEIANSFNFFFNQLARTGHANRVLAMTFSEFGRRVYENGSRGTDHGSGSCLFVLGPGVKGGAATKHPDLKDLDSGDVRWHTDFRRVYATLLDEWMGCDSLRVLGSKFEHLPLIDKKA